MLLGMQLRLRTHLLRDAITLSAAVLLPPQLAALAACVLGFRWQTCKVGHVSAR